MNVNEFELKARMTPEEATAATVQDIRNDIGKFATFIDMLQRGDEDD